MTTADGRGDPTPPATAERFRLMREGLWVTVGQVGGAVGRLAGIRMITGIVSPAVYGEIVLLQGLASLGTSLFCQPVLQASLRYYPEAVSRNKLGALRKLGGSWLAWSTLGICLVLLGGGALWMTRQDPGTTFSAFACTGVVLALDVWRNHENALMNAARLQKDLAIWSTIDAWGRPVVGFFMAIVFGPRAVPVLVGYALAIAAGNAVFRSRTVRPREPAPVSHADPWIRDVREGFLRYAAPLLPLAFLAWLVGIAPRYFIAGLAGAEEAGLFAAVYGLGWTPAMALAGIGQLTLRPVLFDAVSRGDEARERRTLWVWLATVGGGALVLAVVLTLLAPWVVALLLGPAYRGGAVLVPWIAWAYAMQAIQTVFETMLYAQQRTGRVLMMNALGAGVSVALYAVLVPRSGALGAGVAMFISLAVSCGAGFVAAGATRRIFAKRSA